jgi:hypothetical protein
MHSKRTVLTITIMSALIAVAATWMMNRAGAATFTERLLNFSSIGIAMGQTGRLNVTNLGREPITAQFFVFDPIGVNHLPLTEFTVEPGHTTSMNLPFRQIPTDQRRFQIRGMIKVTSRIPTDQITDGTITASMEIFDATSGRTNIALLPAIADPPGETEPQAPDLNKN